MSGCFFSNMSVIGLLILVHLKHRMLGKYLKASLLANSSKYLINPFPCNQITRTSWWNHYKCALRWARRDAFHIVYSSKASTYIWPVVNQIGLNLSTYPPPPQKKTGVKKTVPACGRQRILKSLFYSYTAV